jgi:hypothetical protein
MSYSRDKRKGEIKKARKLFRKRLLTEAQPEIGKFIDDYMGKAKQALVKHIVKSCK